MGGKKGHVALMDWHRNSVMAELHLREARSYTLSFLSNYHHLLLALLFERRLAFPLVVIYVFIHLVHVDGA